MSGEREKPSLIQRLTGLAGVRVIRVQPDNSELIAELRGIRAEQSRIANALEAALLRGFGFDINAPEEIEPESERPAPKGQLSEDDPRYDDFVAALEELEARGVQIPAAAYARLGLDAPTKADTDAGLQQLRDEEELADGEPLIDDDEALELAERAVRAAWRKDEEEGDS